MKRIYLIPLILCCFFGNALLGQDISFYTDQQEHTWVFEKGNIEKLEFLEVPKIKVKGPRILYINSKGYTVEYRNGEKRILDYVDLLDSYHMSDFLLATTQSDVLAVVEEDGKNTISLEPQRNLSLGENILLFTDFDGFMKMYRNGAVEEINANMRIEQRKVSDDTFAIFDESEQLFFFDGNEIHLIGLENPQSFECGRDFVVFLDEYGALKLFYNQETTTLEEYPPMSYKIGDNLLAYVDDDGDFSLVQNGEAEVLDVEPPQYYHFYNNTMVYLDSQDYLKVWYEGKIYDLEAYRPEEMQYFDGVVAWTDRKGYLKAFYKGEQLQVAKQIVNRFDVSGNVITYWINNGDGVVYWKGEHYRY